MRESIEQRINRIRFQNNNRVDQGYVLDTHLPNKEDIVRDLGIVYNYALRNDRWNIALQAKIWQARILGMFPIKK